MRFTREKGSNTPKQLKSMKIMALGKRNKKMLKRKTLKVMVKTVNIMCEDTKNRHSAYGVAFIYNDGQLYVK